jgi:hypothetical protein
METAKASIEILSFLLMLIAAALSVLELLKTQGGNRVAWAVLCLVIVAFLPHLWK